MTCPECDAEATHTDGGGDATWTRYACGNVAEYVKGSGPHWSETCGRRIDPRSTTTKETPPMDTIDSTPHTQVVKLDFAAFIEKMREEWGPLSTPPKTVEEYVATEAVAGLEYAARSAVERHVKEFTDALDTTIEQTMRDMVSERIEERLKRPFQPMKYGEPVGEPISLLDLIDATIEKACSIRPFDSNGRQYGEESLLEKLVKNNVGYRLTEDINKAAKDAKDAVVKAMREQGADIISKNVIALAEGRVPSGR